MKFGKVLTTSLPYAVAWGPHAIAYKQLKGLLKPCVGISLHAKLHAATWAQCRALATQSPRTDTTLQASHTETAFFSTLRDEISKVNRFVVKEQQECSKNLLLLEDSIRKEMRKTMYNRQERHATWLRRIGDLYGQFQALEWFCVLNFCAVSKILKKHDKWTGYTTRRRFEHAVLVKQPFATYVPLQQMMQRVETIAMRICMAAMTELVQSPPLSALCICEWRPVNPIKLAPLRITIDVDMGDTDCEDMTPRPEVELTSEDDSDNYDRRPRQRRRLY